MRDLADEIEGLAEEQIRVERAGLPDRCQPWAFGRRAPDLAGQGGT
jgi:hypothetical protein